MTLDLRYPRQRPLLRALLLGVALTATSLAHTATSHIDLTAADGTALKATYYSPGAPGPAMLLIHQCNQNRKMWGFIAEQLVAAGIHVLALDLRGFGDSGGEGMRGAGGFQSFMYLSTADVDMAYTYLTSQSDVDPTRVGSTSD